MLSGLYERTVPDLRPAFAPQVHISQGQSWRTNAWSSFAAFGIDPQAQTLLPPLTTTTGGGAGPGPLPNSAGINLTGSITGLTHFKANDQVTIGRCAVQAQQLLRVRRGLLPLLPIIEFCCAYPASTWQTGGGGGLSPGAQFTASISNNSMTVTAVASRTLSLSQQLSGAGVPANVFILGGPNPGTTGTYTVGVSTTVVGGTHFTTSGGAAFLGHISVDTLTVESMTSGVVNVGDTITAGMPGGSPTTTIIAFLSGTSGGVGTYQIRVGSPINIGSQAFTSLGRSWTNQGIVIPQLLAALPQGQYLDPVFRSVGYTQADAADLTATSKQADLADMLTLYDTMGLPLAGTTPLNYYLELPAAVSQTTTMDASSYGTYLFCRTHAPGQSGTWSGRCFATAPSYAWQFNGADNIHTGDYGTLRWGEAEGYVKHLVEDLGIMWTPLWRSLGGIIAISGQTITIPFDRPAGPDFAAAAMTWQSDPIDGIKAWPNQGFNVYRSGAPLTLPSVTIAGMSVQLVVQETLVPGDALEVSYAWHGPGGPNPGLNSGVGGNLVMNGPPSVLAAGKTIDAWAWPFFENRTVQ
jgi:hypothetical protein